LKNVASEDETRKNEAKKRSVHGIPEHFGVSQISADFELAYLSRSSIIERGSFSTACNAYGMGVRRR